MRSSQLRELKAEFELLMQEMRNTKIEVDEKLAILDQARELVAAVNQWISQSNESCSRCEKDSILHASRRSPGYR